MSQWTRWLWTHNTYCQPQWKYLIFLFLAESDNGLHTKHRTNKTHDSNSWGCIVRNQLHVGGYDGMGRCGLNMHSLNFEARSDTQIQEHRLAWPVQKLLTFYDVKPNCKALIWIRRIRINHSPLGDIGCNNLSSSIMQPMYDILLAVFSIWAFNTLEGTF